MAVEIDALKYNATPIPATTIKQVQEILTRHTGANFALSLFHLVRDLLFLIVAYYAFGWLRSLEIISECFLYPIYSYVLGTIATGLWVLAHECGHGTFGATKLQNDVVGFVLHSLLLVPYFSWQYSHNKHHKYTNHLILGETHVPAQMRGVVKHKVFFRNCLGEAAYGLLNAVVVLVCGWIIYLCLNSTGGRTTADMKTKLDKSGKSDHFRPSSQIMPDRIGNKVILSSIGCLTTVFFVFHTNSCYDYIGPYLVVNAWLVTYTWLHHSHVAVPHFGDNCTTEEYNHTVGALCTIDRPYPWIIDELHHHIGSSHVAHHLNYAIPHYNAVACTEEIKKVLGDRYLYDPTPICQALLKLSGECLYVNSLEGVQYYKSS